MGIDIFEMLKRFARIISYDYRQRNGIFRILWKSAARWNRLGWDGMLEWLDKEIWKIPNQQKILHIDTNAYRHWIQVREFQRFHSETSYDDLKFSIILAPENNDASLSRIINSLIEQHHQNWELLLLSESFDIQEGNDGRIVFIGECLQQSRIVRYNRGLSLATGEWIIFADEKMVFSPFALVEIAIAIQANSAAELIYTDEDIIDEDGKRSTPHFKSDFNPDLLYSMSYIGRAFGTRLGTARAVGGLSQSASLCADYDFVLRLWEYAGEKAIFHIPKIVFHFEKDEVDTSMRHSCEQQVLREYFARRNEKVSIASGTCPQTHRLHWSLPDTLPFVTIIIPTRDQLEVLQKCIESILHKTFYTSFEIIIADNQSESDETIRYFAELSEMENIHIVPYDKPFNYSAINNYAVTYAKGEIIVFLNNDAEVISPDWLDEMVSQVARSDIGCVGAMLYYPDNTIQHAGVIVGMGDVAGHAHKYMLRESQGYFNRACVVQNFSAVTAACLGIRKTVFYEAKGFDEENLKVAYNDVDLCLKVQQLGYRNLWTPYAQLYHHESKSRGKENTAAKKERSLKEVKHIHSRWNNVLKYDRYYNENLSKIAEQFQLRRMG